MATPRSPRSALIALALAGTAVFTVLPNGLAQADPKPSLAQVERRVNALNDKVDAVVEQYNESKIQLAAASRQAAVAQARVRAAQAQLDAIRKGMASVAAAAYRSGGADQFVQLVSTSTPQTFLDRASSLDRIAAGQSAQLAAARTASHRLATANADARAQRALQAKVSGAIAAQKREIEDALAEQQQLLSGLKADQRRALAARRAALRASRSRSFGGTYDGPASGRPRVAVQAAYDQLGKPYSWGASGPSSYDCSGLTMWAWGKAGVSLPHSSQAQYSSGRHVSRSNIEPGDLVFFGSPIHHVGIYIGGGNMIDAPHSGDVVKIQPAFRDDYVGAVRP